MKHNESALQSSCVKWFNLQYKPFRGLFFSIPNGGYRNAREAAIMKGEGVVAGVADMFLAVPGRKPSYEDGHPVTHGVFFEFKYGKNRQTEAQKYFEAKVIAQGYSYVLIYDFDSFKIFIGAYLKTNN